jgi:hypothetical protein
MIVADGTVNVDVCGNITGGIGPSIDDFDSFWGFSLVMGKVVLAGEFVIDKGISSTSTVN